MDDYLKHPTAVHISGTYSSSISRATTPGLVGKPGARAVSRPPNARTFPYFKLLPYNVEEEAERNAALDEILKHLYVAIKAEDMLPGAVHWTRELRGWLDLKFDLPLSKRVELVKLYYMLALAPGIDSAASERFESVFRLLTK